MKVALVSDPMVVYGGAERVLQELHRLYPEAPIFAPIYNERVFPPDVKSWKVTTSWLNGIPRAGRLHRWFYTLYPGAMGSIDLDEYDVVISSSFNFGHHVLTSPHTRHICYCHAPSRFLWDTHGYARRENFNPLIRGVIDATAPCLRALDWASAQGVDDFIGTSRYVQDRISKFYRRPSAIIPPPIDLRDFPLSRQSDGYFLLLMRLVGWKRADIVVAACTKLGLPLVVAGDGRELANLKRLAGPTVKFAGRVDGRAKAELYANCTALVVPSIEDFGITPLEAMASGKPVLAIGKGGVLDTVIPGVTGAFFEAQSSDAVGEALSAFRPGQFDAEEIRRHAEGYDVTHFRRQIADFVGASLAAGRKPADTQPVAHDSAAA